MFPIPSRDNKLIMFNPSFSPSDRQHSNKSTQLPYFKRFPNSKFLSQQRKRIQRFDLKELASPQNQNRNRVSFFRREKAVIQCKHSHKQQIKAFSSSVLKPDRESKKKKLIKQLYEREGTKLRQKTDFSPEHRRSSIHNNKNSLLFQQQSNIALTPLGLLRGNNNLQPYEKQQIMSYSEIYYFGQNCKQKKSTILELTKADGSYNWLTGDHIHFRYQILQILGQGSFGEVFKCCDHKKGKNLLALKIVKDNQKYSHQAKTQIRLLNYIKSKDSTGAKNCVHIKDSFNFRNRICMTFDLMSINLYQLIKNNGYYGLPLDLIRRMSLQILNAIHFLHKNQIIHADLKPENILLKEANKSGVKVIDFGSSCFQKQTIYTYIQSRYYRAPEVILGLPYNRKIDIWSFACIIAQLYLGYPLFAGDEQHQQICLIVQVLGFPPQNIGYSAKRWDLFFDKSNKIKNHPKLAEPGSKSLKMALENTEDQDFIDFILKCLSWTSQDRYQALDCLRHDWILKGLPEQIRQQHLKFVNEEENIKTNSNYRKMSSFTIHNRNKIFH